MLNEKDPKEEIQYKEDRQPEKQPEEGSMLDYYFEELERQNDEWRDWMLQVFNTRHPE